jgi:hypothetical protein
MIGWLWLAIPDAHAAVDVLYCVDRALSTDQMAVALADLSSSYAVTSTSSMTDCEAYIASGGWELVIVFVQNKSYSLPNFNAYVSGGGRAIHADWTRSTSRATLFGATYAAETNATSLDVDASLASGVSTNPIKLTSAGWSRFSMTLTPASAASSGATLGIGSGIVVGGGGKTVINGFLSDAAGTDLAAVYANEIASVLATADACDGDLDGYATAACGGADCDDRRPSVYPGAVEVCDGRDQDCDGTIDDGVKSRWYRDVDGDGFGAASSVLFACTLPTGYIAADGDCDDARADVNPLVAEVCDGEDEDCDGIVDDGVATEFFFDADADGHGLADLTTLACALPDGYADVGDDCDDVDGAVFPGAAEACNEADDDCDTLVDEGAHGDYYADADLDGYGDPGFFASLCGGGVGWVEDSTDCNDGRGDVFPGAVEVCDAIDGDCDGLVDEGVLDLFFLDADADGAGDASAPREACAAPIGYVSDDRDCDDARDDVSPTALEACDLADNDCDGAVDEDVETSYFRDVDGDHHGDGAIVAAACSAPTGYVDDGDDCDDGDVTVFPGAGEACDGVDDDCDGRVDDGVTLTWYGDADADGYGAADEVVDTCAPPLGYVASADDCDDASEAVYPGAIETCDDVDEDCDGIVDDDPVDPTDWHLDADGDGFGSPDVVAVACDGGPGTVASGDDCDDTSPDIYPGAVEIPYDGADQSCDGADVADADLDGFDAIGAGGTDCNDADPGVFVGAAEIADGRDNDCDGAVDEGTGWSDEDGDGYAEVGGDCDDTDAAIGPLAAESCDGVDEDCDGKADEGTGCADDDGDGFTEVDGDCDDANADVSPDAEEDFANGRDDDCDGVTDAGTADRDGDGYAAEAGDCNDLDPAVFPGAVEREDGIDQDCDGVPDDGTAVADDDGDGWTEVDGDCNDADADVAPDAPERASNGRDDDCDGEVDEDGRYVDDDNDGFSDATGDCDDGDPTVRPGAAELENGRDDDCDGAADEGFSDRDQDGYAWIDGDCDDDNGWINPGEDEVLDGLDNDCDGRIDDGLTDDAFEDTGSLSTSEGCACAVPPGAPARWGWWAAVTWALVAVRARRG